MIEWKEAARAWCLDLHHNDAQLNGKGEYWAFYQQGQREGGFDLDGVKGKWGKVRFWLKGMREGGQVLFLPGGDFVVSGTNQYDFKEGENKKFPAFDFFLARYSGEGELRWSTNLYQEGDSVHTPDQKAVDLAYDAARDEVICLVKQHGSNVYRLMGDLSGDTGNLMIGWVGRVSAQDGKLKAGWYFQNNRNGKYEEDGRPVSPPYPKLSGNDLRRVAVGKDGRVFLCGSAGAMMWTTGEEAKGWPEGKGGGQEGCFVILDRALKRVLWAEVTDPGEKVRWFGMLVREERGEVVLVGKKGERGVVAMREWKSFGMNE